MSDYERMKNRLESHQINDEGSDRISAQRIAALDYAYSIIANCPKGRERELALMRVEESLMWANAGIARDPGYQV